MESLHARGMELANNLSLMTQKPRNGDLRELKYQKCPTEACPQASLEACTFAAHSGNWSVLFYPRSMPAWDLKKEQHQRMGWVGSIKVGNFTHPGRRAIVNTEIINTDNF